MAVEMLNTGRGWMYGWIWMRMGKEWEWRNGNGGMVEWWRNTSCTELMDVDGCGWMWMDVDGCGWMWMDVDGCGWMWMDVDGCGWMWMDVDGGWI
jgi:hypothetical protein